MITNDGNTLTVGDEATISGGAGSGARVQVQDISGAGVDEVIVNGLQQNFQEGDTLTFSSGTVEAKYQLWVVVSHLNCQAVLIFMLN